MVLIKLHTCIYVIVISKISGPLDSSCNIKMDSCFFPSTCLFSAYIHLRSKLKLKHILSFSTPSFL